MKKTIYKTLAFILVLILAFGTPLRVSAATGPDVTLPNASYYLTSYGASVERLGGGVVYVYSRTTGTSSWAKIGATRIVLEESSDNVNWSTVGNYHYSAYSSMMGSNVTRHVCTTPNYQGHSGWYYRAYVTVWAGSSMSTGDSRSFWTITVQAT